MDTKTLPQAELHALVTDLLAAGTRVVAPVQSAASGPLAFELLKDASAMVLDGPLPHRSIKEQFLPPTEELLRWKQQQSAIEIQEVPTRFAPTVLLGARPCDAAAPGIVDKVMGWDYRDELWFGRREATTMIAVACPGQDQSCFCTAVGLGPDSVKGSDILLTPIESGYHVKVLTEKGASLVEAHEKRFSDANGEQQACDYHAKARARVEKNRSFDPKAVTAWLKEHFEAPLWSQIALRCHGCSACASLCPTCHCFDIIDEPSGVAAGARRRNWDSCQVGRFTLHASGHNPRASQNERFRQRITHKFSIYPQKFEEVLCTGCGRCARACPAGMDLVEILGEISALSQGDRIQG